MQARFYRVDIALWRATLARRTKERAIYADTSAIGVNLSALSLRQTEV
jgi:hypothetical protein